MEERTDGKLLADTAIDWTMEDPSDLAAFGVSAQQMALLMEMLNSIPQTGDKTGESEWYDPRRVGAMFRDFLEAVPAMREDGSVVERMGWTADEVTDVTGAWHVALEDAVALCDWAAERGRRVSLVVW